MLPPYVFMSGIRLTVNAWVLQWERTPDYFDLVHFRNMSGAFKNWSFIYEQALRVVKPGGWIEILDYDDYWAMQNFMSYFEPGSIIHRVTRDVNEAAELSGRAQGVGHLDPRLLYEAGFRDIQITEHAIPFSPREMSTGHLWLLAIRESIEATTLRLLTTYKGWSASEVRMAVSILQEELQTMALNPERARGFVMKIKVLTGRKPDTPADSYSRRPGGTEDGREVMADDVYGNYVPHVHLNGVASPDTGSNEQSTACDRSSVSSERRVVVGSPFSRSDSTRSRGSAMSVEREAKTAGAKTTTVDGRRADETLSTIRAADYGDKQTENGLMDELIYARANGAVVAAPVASSSRTMSG
jgi:hypothetical protein